MQLLILYRPRSEFARTVEDFVNNFKTVYPDREQAIRLMDVDSVEGSHKAEAYDIMQSPAILALADDGGLLNAWLGPDLPLMNEVAGYIHE